jgi:hypothetical protein
VNGLFTGQVASNLGRLAINYNNAARRFDFSLGYSDGIYTGRKLDSNRRWSVDGNVGKSLGGTPYFRLAYGFGYSSFDFDAEAPSMPLHRAGGYFSPTRFLLNYGALTISHKLHDRLQFEATGTAGVQNVGSTTAHFDNPQVASSFAGRLLWRISARNEARIQYDFLNVYNAFHRHQVSATWRHYL